MRRYDPAVDPDVRPGSGIASGGIQRSGRARKREAAAGADRFLSQAHKKTVIVKNFRDSVFPYSGLRIKSCFEQLRRSCRPDLILTYYRDDLHQDHRVISELT